MCKTRRTCAGLANTRVVWQRTWPGSLRKLTFNGQSSQLRVTWHKANKCRKNEKKEKERKKRHQTSEQPQTKSQNSKITPIKKTSSPAVKTASTPTLTFLHRLRIVRPILETAYVPRKPNPALELARKDIALVEEEHELDVREELVGADHLPEEDAVFLFVLLCYCGGGGGGGV